MKLKMLLMAGCLLLPISSAFAETVDEYVAGLKKEASIGNTEAQKELDQFQELSKKANAGDAQAQYDLGMFWDKRTPEDTYSNRYMAEKIKYNQGQQEKWLLKSASSGNGDAQRALISLYTKQIKFLSDNSDQNTPKQIEALYAKIKTILEQLVAKGDGKAQYALAMYYLEKGDAQMKKKAGDLIKKAADQGVLDARFDLGKGYLTGTKGIEKNYNKAKEVFEKLVEDKRVGGFYYLAECYQHGYGVEKDEAKAVKLYEVAADNGYTDAAAMLSTIYLTGIDNVVPKDREKMVKYYNQVCAGGSGYSGKQMKCMNLQTDIMGACMKLHNNSNEYLEPNSDIDPECRQVITKAMSHR